MYGNNLTKTGSISENVMYYKKFLTVNQNCNNNYAYNLSNQQVRVDSFRREFLTILVSHKKILKVVMI